MSTSFETVIQGQPNDPEHLNQFISPINTLETKMAALELGNGRPFVGCSLHEESTATTSVTANTWTLAELWAASENPQGLWSGSAPGRMTMERGGRYLLSASIALTTSTAGLVDVEFRVNGTAPSSKSRASAQVATGGVLRIDLTRILTLSAEDYVEVWFRAVNSGYALNMSAEWWFHAIYLGD